MKATAGVQPPQPEANTTEVEVHMASYFWFVHLQTRCSQQYTLWTVVEALQAVRAMHERHS